MTALPDPSEFSTTLTSTTPKTALLVRPTVTEHFWGYAISSHDQVVGLAVLMRSVAGLVTLASFIGALAVWFLPAAAFAGDAIMIKAMASILMTCIGAMLMNFVGRGTRVRVHVDTAAGELHEVVGGLFGSDVILARYGMDAVESIDVVPSLIDPDYGQIQIAIKGAATIGAGNGDVAALHGLRDRLANDMGLEYGSGAREAVWSGPLAS